MLSSISIAVATNSSRFVTSLAALSTTNIKIIEFTKLAISRYSKPQIKISTEVVATKQYAKIAVPIKKEENAVILPKLFNFCAVIFLNLKPKIF